jgi:phospholipid/cholesterol/gamma-HCH transport system substrate-binding protein
MQSSLVETIVGAIVLVVAGSFLAFAYSSTDIGKVKGYELTARFDKIDGLKLGSDVRLAGIKVGTVSALRVDTETYQAEAKFQILPNLKLPDDSSAKIASDGLLGGKFLALEPGGGDTMLAPGARIKHTQGSINLEELLGKYVFSPPADKPAK